MQMNNDLTTGLTLSYGLTSLFSGRYYHVQAQYPFH